MKKLILAVLIAIGAVAGWYLFSRIEHAYSPIELTQSNESSSFANTNRARVAAYNIAHGRGGQLGASNWIYETENELIANLDRIADQINQLAPDILVLNEVDFATSWSFSIDQADYLADKCGYKYVLKQRNFGVSLPFYRLHFGNALLSKYPISHADHLRFEPFSAKESYLAGNHNGFIAQIDVPWQKISIVGVHLEYRDEPTRVEAAKRIVEATEGISHPVIALGDFNSSAGNDTAINFLLESNFKPSMNGMLANATFPSEKPERKIDWIMGQGEIQFANAKVVSSSHSDHLMIVSEILPANGPPPSSMD